MDIKPYKIPQSVLVVIYRGDGQVLLLRRTIAAPGGEPFWQSVTGSKDSTIASASSSDNTRFFILAIFLS